MRFPCATDDKAERFCETIAVEMARLFDLPYDDAVSRINAQWRNQKIGGDEEIAYHEDEVFWAQDIYWGHGSFWWIEGDQRTQRGLAPLTPKQLE